MTEDILEKIAQIHETEYQAAFVIAGAGHSFLSWLLDVPGASNTVLEAIIPYSTEAMRTLLSFTPEKAVSRNTAIEMALIAYRKANKQTKFPVGVACTATIRTNKPKRGEHKAVILTWLPEKTTIYSVLLAKNERSREEEELMISYILLSAFCQAVNINPFGLKIKLLPGDKIDKEEIKTPKLLKQRD